MGYAGYAKYWEQDTGETTTAIVEPKLQPQFSNNFIGIIISKDTNSHMQIFRNGEEGVKRIKDYEYLLQDLIGKGNFAKVYRGVNTKNQQPVAIKVIALDILRSRNLEALVDEEIKVLHQAKHPNILSLLEALVSDRHCYLVTELCEGGNLEERLRSKRPLNDQELRSIIADVYLGLRELREMGVCHRDIKAANIFLKEGRAKIADFGLSKFYKQNFKDLDIGSPLFMAPEGIIHHTYGEKTDVWSFGAFIYELLHGGSPFQHCRTEIQLKKAIVQPIPGSKFKASIQPELRQLIDRLLTIDEEKRPTIVQVGQEPYIKEALGRRFGSPTKKGGLNVVQTSRRLGTVEAIQPRKKSEGKLQLVSNRLLRKNIELGGKSHPQPTAANRSTRLECSSRPSLIAKKHTNFKTERTGGEVADSGLESVAVESPCRLANSSRFRINSAKTIETRDSEEERLLRRGQYRHLRK